MDGYFDVGTIADTNGIVGNSTCRGNATLVKLWVPNTVKSIETWAFAECSNLEEVVFQSGGEQPLDVGLMAFQNCSRLRKVVLPSHLRSVGRSCFRNCSSLVELIVEEGDQDIQVVQGIFTGCTNPVALEAVIVSEANRRAKIPAYERDTPAAKAGGYLVFPALSEEMGLDLPEGIPDGTLAVCVDQTWGVKLADPGTGQRVSLEDCARGYWCVMHLHKVRLSQCRWLMAVAGDRIAQIWKIDLQTGWRDPEEIPKQTWPSDRGPWKVARQGCKFLPDDAEVDAVRALCVGRPITIYFRQSQTVRGVFVQR